MKTRRLVLVGAGLFADVACEYFEAYTDYRVAGFAVERAHKDRDVLFDRPVVAFEDIETAFPPDQHHAFVAIVYTQMNRVRTRLMATVAAKGYALASFVSDRAFVAPSAQLGEHCFVFENNVIQSHVRLGDNVVLWSGNHIGHHASLDDNVFVSSHVVVSGSCRIGRNCFLGVNSAIGDGVTVAEDCWIGPGVTLTGDTKPRQIHRAPKGEIARADTHRFFKLER